jgi:hypothetical protein
MTSSAFAIGATAPSGAYYVSGLSNGGIASAVYYPPTSMPQQWNIQNAITPDGSTMAGRYYYNGPDSNYAVGAMWKNGSITQIGAQTDLTDATEFSATSADGSILVGTTQMGQEYSEGGTAVIYNSSLGLMNLGDYMTNVLGLPATTGCGGAEPTDECWVPTGISADGSVIVGYIDSSDGGPSDDQSFILTVTPLPEPGALCAVVGGGDADFDAEETRSAGASRLTCACWAISVFHSLLNSWHIFLLLRLCALAVQSSPQEYSFGVRFQ